MIRASLSYRIVASVALFAVCAGAVTSSNPQLPDPGNPGMSRPDQEKLGLKAMAEVYKEMPVLPDSSPVTQYVQRLGAKLVKQIPQQYSWPYQFHVVQQKDINAFALPGGPIRRPRSFSDEVRAHHPARNEYSSFQMDHDRVCSSVYNRQRSFGCEMVTVAQTSPSNEMIYSVLTAP